MEDKQTIELAFSILFRVALHDRDTISIDNFLRTLFKKATTLSAGLFICWQAGPNIQRNFHSENKPAMVRGEVSYGYNKPATAQVGASLKAQKQRRDFKVLSILFESTRKPKRGPNWRAKRFFNIQYVAEYQKIEEGTLWRHSYCRKISKGGRVFSLVRFCMLH